MDYNAYLSTNEYYIKQLLQVLPVLLLLSLHDVSNLKQP